MTIREAIAKYSKVEIDLLLSHTLGKPKEFIFMNPEGKLTSMQVRKLLSMTRRRKKGEPLAYILGYKDFMGLRFKVNKNVLIPRPETEQLVDKVFQVCKVKSHQLSIKDYGLRILDVGTGSGCIAVTLAKELGSRNREVRITATDISTPALTVAKQNTKIILGERSDTSMYQSRIKFIKSDLLKSVKGDFDIIIANLPYGWRGVKNRFSSVKDGLKFEPENALYTKEKGLYEIRRLLEQVKQLKYVPKLVYLEFDPRQKNELQKTIKKILPESKAEFYKDLNNFWRFVEIKN